MRPVYLAKTNTPCFPTAQNSKSASEAPLVNTEISYHVIPFREVLLRMDKAWQLELFSGCVRSGPARSPYPSSNSSMFRFARYTIEPSARDQHSILSPESVTTSSPSTVE